MSDKRRRRKGVGEESEGSDLSETEPDTKALATEHGDSEYESADDNIVNSPKHVGKVEDVEDDEDEEENVDVDLDVVEEDLDYDGENDEEDGGGEEPFPEVVREDDNVEGSQTPVDDDEDKKNPQYIPKKGMFYEHDNRLGTDEEDNVEETPEDKKKIWKADVVERWGHDKFAEFDQEPKSKDELVESYGYDIRNEDNAPRARRRRRYGRGPNKYTRNWEDEDAYSKPVAGQKPRNPGSKDKSGNDQLEDFPALPSRDENDKPNKSSIKSESLNSELKPAVVRDVPRASADREDGFRHDRRGRGNDDGMRSRGRGGRGMRGGGYEQSRRGGDRGRGADRGRPVGFGRGGYEDRKRYNDRHGGHDDRGYEDEYRGGRGGRSRGRGSRGFDGMEQKQGRRHIKDPGLTPRTEELGDQVANLDINKENENSVPRGSKRYSHQRKGGIEVQSLSSEQQNLQEMLNEGINPAMCSGPPSGAPFQSQIPSQRLPHNNIVSHSGVRPVPAAYIQTSQIMNFNPQYPVPVTVSAVSLPMGVGGVPLATIPAMTSNGGPQIIGPGFANGPDAVMLAAAQPGPDGFAAVRGGVTYFNPTAQNILPQRPVSKRPKAAIPIVDPSVVETKDYIVESSRQELPSQL